MISMTIGKHIFRLHLHPFYENSCSPRFFQTSSVSLPGFFSMSWSVSRRGCWEELMLALTFCSDAVAAATKSIWCLCCTGGSCQSVDTTRAAHQSWPPLQLFCRMAPLTPHSGLCAADMMYGRMSLVLTCAMIYAIQPCGCNTLKKFWRNRYFCIECPFPPLLNKKPF